MIFFAGQGNYWKPVFESGNAIANQNSSSNTASAVSVYSKCGFEGSRANLDIGEYNAAGLELLGISDNTISSIKVNPGFQAELFFFDFLRGKSGYLRSDDNCLSNDGFDNEISSIRVTRVTDNSSPRDATRKFSSENLALVMMSLHP